LSITIGYNIIHFLNKNLMKWKIYRFISCENFLALLNTQCFDGLTNPFVSLSENGIYRGYLGSYSGAASDMDFGNGLGNTLGKIHFTIESSPRLTHR